MSYVFFFINAIVVALMAIYVYENERKIGKMSVKHDRTDMFVNAILVSCCSSLISSESCLGSEDESLLSGTCMESTLQTLATRLKAKPLRCPFGWKEFAYHCYNFVTTTLPWTEAEWACRKLGGYLVKVNDKTENNWLKEQAIALDNSYWLGAADLSEGDWTWVVDFSKVTFTDWSSGQPDNSAGLEDCLHIEKTYHEKTYME